MEPKLRVCVGQVALLIFCEKNLKKEKNKLYCFCNCSFNGRLLTSLKKINCKEALKRERQAKGFI